MPFRAWIRVSPKNHVLNGSPAPLRNRGNYWGGDDPCDASFRPNSLTICFFLPSFPLLCSLFPIGQSLPVVSPFYRAMLCIRGTNDGPVSVCVCVCLSIAEGPRDASCQLKSWQLPRNSAETRLNIRQVLTKSMV